MSALFDAIEGGRLDEVQRLLASGAANVTDRDADGHTPLMKAAWGGRLNIVQWLLLHGGSDISERGPNGTDAVMCAAIFGYLDVLQWLIEHGRASVTERSLYGNTACLYAARSQHLEVMEWLLRHGGADINESNNNGLTVWSLLTVSGLHRLPLDQLSPLLKTMLARGVPPPSFSSKLPTSLQPLVAQGAVVLQRMPANSPWRAQRIVALHASNCGLRLISGIVAVIDGYAAMSEEELWALVKLQQPATPSSSGVTGVPCKHL
jgi:hypothetical protein